MNPFFIQVVWRRVNEESPLTYGKIIFTPNKNVEVESDEISEDETRWDLIIKNVSQDDAGVYACQIAATNNYTQNITLSVLGKNCSKKIGVVYKIEIFHNKTKYTNRCMFQIQFSFGLCKMYCCHFY